MNNRYLIQVVQYEPDQVTVRNVLKEVRHSDLLDAFQIFNHFRNALIIDLKENKLIAKKSTGFRHQQIKQYYLNFVCEQMHRSYMRLKDLKISEDVDESFNRLIDRILIENLDLNDPSVKDPIMNELAFILSSGGN